jgi:hypothetical protein
MKPPSAIWTRFKVTISTAFRTRWNHASDFANAFAMGNTIFLAT